MDYYQKYLKYKAKYLELKKSLEGRGDKCGVKDCDFNKNWCSQTIDDKGKTTKYECIKKLEKGEQCNHSDFKCSSNNCDPKTNKCV
jgi:hypothetical protein